MSDRVLGGQYLRMSRGQELLNDSILMVLQTLEEAGWCDLVQRHWEITF